MTHRAAAASRFPADRARRAAQARSRVSTRLLARPRAPRLLRAVSGAAVSLAGDVAAGARRRVALVGVGIAVHRRRHAARRGSRGRCCGCRSRRSPHASSAASASTPTSRSRSASRVAGAPGVAAISLLVGVLVPDRQRRRRRRCSRASAARGVSRASSRAIRWCSRARPASRGSSRACRCRRDRAHPRAARGRGAAARAARRRRGLALARGTLPLPALRLVERREARRAAGDRAGARDASLAALARSSVQIAVRDGRRADGAVGLHPRDADEWRRRAGGAADLERNAARGVTLPLWLACDRG